MNYFRSFSQISLMSVLLAQATLSNAGTMGDVQDDSNHFIFYAAPIYGTLSDEGINKTIYAGTILANGASTTQKITPDSKWGYSLGIGYQFGQEKGYDVVLSYTNLKNNGFNSISTSAANDVLVNNLSQIVQDGNNTIFGTPTHRFGGKELIGPATALVSSYYKFQTADLITHRNYHSLFSNKIHFSKYYGIKATEFKKGFSARYTGIFNSLDVLSNFPAETRVPLTDQINYEAKYFGIGPRIGTGASWELARFLSVEGDASLALLGGSYNTRWNETLVTSPTAFIPGLQQQGTYTYNQSSPTTVWTSLIFGSNLALATHFDFSNGGVFKMQGGINTEQYWTPMSGDSIKASRTVNSLNFNQTLAVRDLFIKLSYIS